MYLYLVCLLRVEPPQSLTIMLLIDYSSPDPTERLIAIEGVVGTTSDSLRRFHCRLACQKKQKNKNKKQLLVHIYTTFHI